LPLSSKIEDCIVKYFLLKRVSVFIMLNAITTYISSIALLCLSSHWNKIRACSLVTSKAGTLSSLPCVFQFSL